MPNLQNLEGSSFCRSLGRSLGPKLRPNQDSVDLWESKESILRPQWPHAAKLASCSTRPSRTSWRTGWRLFFGLMVAPCPYYVPQLRPVSPFLPIICLLPAEGCVVCLVVVVRPSVNDRWASRRSAIRSTRPIELATSVGSHGNYFPVHYWKRITPRRGTTFYKREVQLGSVVWL